MCLHLYEMVCDYGLLYCITFPQALAKQREEELSKLRHQHETQLKALKEQLNKEYHDLEEKLRCVVSLLL